MARIEFSLDYYKSHPDCKVETRDGKPARIVCTDLLDECKQHIVALVQYTATQEKMISVCANGVYNGSYGHDYDLFIVTDEPEELTEFAVQLEQMLYDWEDRGIEARKIVGDWKDKLLSLAREQLIHEGYIIEKKAFHDAVEKVEPEVMKEVSANLDLANFVYDLGEKYPEVSFAKLTRIAKAAYDYGKTEALKDLPRWEKCEKP